jgi:hypothetical protein
MAGLARNAEKTSADATVRLLVEIAVAYVCVGRAGDARQQGRDSWINFANRISRFAISASSRVPNGNFQDYCKNIFIAKSYDSESAL